MKIGKWVAQSERKLIVESKELDGEIWTITTVYVQKYKVNRNLCVQLSKKTHTDR